MIRIKHSIPVLLLFAILALAACQKYYAEDQDDEDVNEDPSDYTWDTSTFASITLNGTSVTITPENAAAVSGTKVTILKAGTYKISGTLSDGQIIVNSEDDANVRLILNGVSITCSNSAPVYIKQSCKTIINLADDTENSLTDGTSYSTTDEPNAALFSNSDLSIYGDGSLTVKGNYNDGISSDDGLVIKSGTISVTAADDGIRGKDYLIIRNGKITINSKGDGLKSDNETSASLGFIAIDSGIVKINASAGDGISAQTALSIADGSFTVLTGTYAGKGGEETNPPGPGPGGGSGGYSGTISEKGLKGLTGITIAKGTFTIKSADDAIHSNSAVEINDGSFSITTGDDAIHANAAVTINGGSLNVSSSYEGIESASITFNDGRLILNSTDDGFNATMGAAVENNDGSSAKINGGYVVVNCTTGDGIDSNGNLTISGGTVIVDGPQSAPEVGFDVNGTFSMAGGFFIATGPNSGNMIETPATSSAQYSVKVTVSSGLTSSTLISIQDASGNSLVTYKPVRTAYYVVFSSPQLMGGSTFSVYTGGSSTGTYDNGIYTGGTYSGGTLKKTFTISGKVTSVSF